MITGKKVKSKVISQNFGITLFSQRATWYREYGARGIFRGNVFNKAGGSPSLSPFLGQFYNQFFLRRG